MFTKHAFKQKKLDLERIQQNQVFLYLDCALFPSVSPLKALLHK